MPSDTTPQTTVPITGRCYCGARTVWAGAAPQTVTYCHCADCRRVSGAPVAAFAAFDAGQLGFEPPLAEGFSVSPGVRRWFCSACGSPLAATYDYLPGQVYVPLGILDNAADFPPQGHAHAGAQLPWLHIVDDLPRDAASARDRLKDAARS